MKKSTVGVLLVLMFAALIVTGCDGLGRTVEVPDLTKSTLENAKVSLDRRGLLIYVVDKIESDEVEEGLICKQDPLLLSDVKRGSTVKVWISTGSGKVEIPSMENASLNDVLRKLAELGLYSNVEFIHSETVPKDVVISLDPAPGTKVEKNSYVQVNVSMGPESVKTGIVPNVIRLSKSAAEKKIEEAGLKAKFIYRVHTEYYEGTLYAQSPKAGSVVPIGSTVTAYIATVLD
jgi:beta-lactam-binding protein with PASTA domain